MVRGLHTERRCPKCGGSLFPDSDYYPAGLLAGRYDYEYCLQCGYIRYTDMAVSNQRKKCGDAFIAVKTAVGTR